MGFSTNNYVYLYYTASENGGYVNLGGRYTFSTDNEAAFDWVLVDNIPSRDANHNAGELRFGKDGYLYVSVGDGGCEYEGSSGCSGENDAATPTRGRGLHRLFAGAGQVRSYLRPRHGPRRYR